MKHTFSTINLFLLHRVITLIFVRYRLYLVSSLLAVPKKKGLYRQTEWQQSNPIRVPVFPVDVRNRKIIKIKSVKNHFHVLDYFTLVDCRNNFQMDIEIGDRSHALSNSIRVYILPLLLLSDTTIIIYRILMWWECMVFVEYLIFNIYAYFIQDMAPELNKMVLHLDPIVKRFTNL